MATTKTGDFTPEQLKEQTNQARAAKARQIVTAAQGPASLVLTALGLFVASTALTGGSGDILASTLAAFLIVKGVPPLEIRLKK